MPTKSKTPRDWSRTGTVQGFAEYLQKQAGAFVVLVIRRDDAVLCVDSAIALTDAEQLVTTNWPELAAGVTAARQEQKRTARLNWGDMRE
jgi:hypothetical protein